MRVLHDILRGQQICKAATRDAKIPEFDIIIKSFRNFQMKFQRTLVAHGVAISRYGASGALGL